MKSKKKKKPTPQFEIVHFSDYHEIEPYSGDFWDNCWELGCFPVSGFACCRYFGLFWNGRKPSNKKIFELLVKKVSESVIHFSSGEEIDFDESEISYPTK